MSKSTNQLFLYSFFMAGAAILGMLKLTVYAKLLSVEGFGLYSLVISSYLFIMYAGSFGLNEALVKKGSIAYGREEFSFIVKLRDVAVLYSTLGVLFFSIITLILVQLFVEGDDIKNSLSLMGFLALATLEFNLMSSYFRVNHEFVLFSFMLFLKSLLVIILAWYIAPGFGVNGVILLEVFVFLFLASFSIYLSRFRPKLKRVYDAKSLFKEAVKQGLPIMSATVIRNLTLSLDRWVIVASLGVIALAKYAFAMILYQAAMVGIGMISTILGTKWLAQFGRDSNLDAMYMKIKEFMIIGSTILIVLSFPLLNLILYLVDFFYPNYSEMDVNLAIIFVYFGVIFLALAYLLDWVFIASSNEKLLIKFSLYSLLITVLLMFFCYWLQVSIWVYACMFLLIRAFNFLVLFQSLSSLLKTRKVLC